MQLFSGKAFVRGIHKVKDCEKSHQIKFVAISMRFPTRPPGETCQAQKSGNNLNLSSNKIFSILLFAFG